jgi:prefoldin subunit 5
MNKIEFESDEVKAYVQQLQAVNGILAQQLDQLKAEVKSKTEYIQEQRDIINQYSKEIEMYKKCQGKRASKREEELKTENKHLNDLLNQALKELEKTRETLTEIKEIAEDAKTKVFVDMEEFWKQILQKISECEVVND